MSTVSLEYFKQHCRVDDIDIDDSYLQKTLDEAEEWLETATHRSIDDLLEIGGGTLPKPLVRAVLMLGGHWYNQREAVGNAAQTAVPYGVSTLVKPFVKLVSE